MNKENEKLATAPPKVSALSLMAGRLQIEPAKLHKTLTETVFKGANDSELMALVMVANEYSLNPLLKEIYAFPAKGGGITPLVGFDGWMKIINRNPQYDGMQIDYTEGETGNPPVSATCTMHLKNRKHPIIVTEYFDECSRNTEPWKTMPRRMLRHKAIMQCARIAFGVSGIQDEDEGRVRNVEARVVATEQPTFTISTPDSIADTSPDNKTEPTKEPDATDKGGAASDAVASPSSERDRMFSEIIERDRAAQTLPGQRLRMFSEIIEWLKEADETANDLLLWGKEKGFWKSDPRTLASLTESQLKKLHTEVIKK